MAGGYSVFSVSKSQEDALKRYIKGQAEHHKTEDFKSELLRTLRALRASSSSKSTLSINRRAYVQFLRPSGADTNENHFPTGSAALHP